MTSNRDADYGGIPGTSDSGVASTSGLIFPG